jgi:hypothetical protein
VTLGIHLELAALEHLGLVLDHAGCRIAGLSTPEDRLHPLDQKPLRERFADKVVSAHLEAEQLIDLFVLRGEEDHRQLAALAEPAEQLHPVHARHLDVENGKVGRALCEAVQRACPVIVGLGLVALRLEDHTQGGEDITIVVDKCDCWHLEAPCGD